MSENSPEPGKPKKPFELPIKWVIAAILIFMLIYNFLLFRSATEESAPQAAPAQTESE